MSETWIERLESLGIEIPVCANCEHKGDLWINGRGDVIHFCSLNAILSDMIVLKQIEKTDKCCMSYKEKDKWYK